MFGRGTSFPMRFAELHTSPGEPLIGNDVSVMTVSERLAALAARSENAWHLNLYSLWEPRLQDLLPLSQWNSNLQWNKNSYDRLLQGGTWQDQVHVSMVSCPRRRNRDMLPHHYGYRTTRKTDNIIQIVQKVYMSRAWITLFNIWPFNNFATGQDLVAK